MQATVQIIDQTTGQPVPSASWQVADSSGNLTQAGGVADANGSITFDTAKVDPTNGYLLISDVSYSPVLINAGVAINTGYIDLLPDYDGLPAATVYPSPKAALSPWLILGVLVALAASTGKTSRRKVAGLDIGWEKLLVSLGIAAGAYFLILRPILVKLGILSPGSTDQNAAAGQSTSATATTISQLQAQGGPQAIATYSAANYSGWADDVYKQGTASTVNEDTIKWDVIQVNTLMDLLLLRQAFGNRPAGGSFLSTCQLLGINCPLYSLDTFLSAVLSQSTINSINGYLSSGGINYQF